jgi:RNA polymerase sigma-70 factor (ECF subfamily)
MARPALRRVGRSTSAVPARPARLDRDRSLVEAARADPAHFDALYRKYLAQVYSFAVYELRNHHDAEDATERTFLSALAALPRFDDRADPVEDGPDASTFRLWLFRIARNVIAEHRRAARRRPSAPLELVATAADPLDVEADAVRRESTDAALRAVDRLPEDRRRALLLRFVHELSTREIAAVLGRSEGAVRVLIHRGLRRVAVELGDAGPAVRTAERAATRPDRRA